MKTIVIYLLLFCIPYTIYSQELYMDIHSKDTCLFLGGIVDGNQFKVVENGDVVFKKAKDLTQVGLLIGNEFTDELFNKNLCFKLEGYEPFWDARIFRNIITLWIPGDDVQRSYKIHLHTSEGSMSPDFFALFSTECGTIFGSINNIGVSSNKKQRICEYNLADEDSLYEVYISIQGLACKGCATIEHHTEE